ncbi:MAG: methyltransferase [Chloroflexi bacterium]|nr:methyltransferase [Chloroflexota bacterium]
MMKPRERVLTALAHKEPDRVPIDFGGMRSTGIMALAYAPLKRSLGIEDGSIDVYDVGQQLALVEEPVRQRFGVDVVPLDFDALGPWQPYTLPDGTPARVPAHYRIERAEDGTLYILNDEGRRVAAMPPDGYYFDSIYHPLADAQTVDDLKAFSWSGRSDEDLARLREEARRLYNETDYAIMGAFGGNILESGQGLRGWEQFMLDLAYGGPFLETFLELLTENHLRNLERYLGAVGEYIQIIQMGDDLGTQRGPQISVDMYRRWIKPYHKRIYGWVHDHYPDIYVFLHCCGGVYDLIPDLIDAGVDILNPVQTSAHGMDPVRLKREFGRDLVFWGGGCETQSTLPHGTPEEVRQQVKERLEIFAPDGGYVFNQIHNIQHGVPPENITAMFEAALAHGSY